jgi:hypothetical protein
MKPVLRSAVVLASLCPIVLLSSLVIDAFPFAPGHRSTLARANREDPSLASNDRAVRSPTVSLSEATESPMPHGAGTRPIAFGGMSCVKL